MTKDQIKTCIREKLWTGKQFNPNALNPKSKLYIDNKECIDKIFELTAFLDIKKDVKFPERCYCVLNDITSFPLCSNPTCMQYSTSFNNMVSSDTYGYRRYCSKKCANTDLLWTEEAMLERSNRQKQSAVKSVDTKSKWTKEQKQENSRKVSMGQLKVLDNGLTVAQNKSVKTEKRKHERYGCGGNVNPVKTEQTMLEKYGVRNGFQTPRAKQRSLDVKEERWEIQRKNYFERCVTYYNTTTIKIISSYEAFRLNRDNIATFHCDECNTDFDYAVFTNGIPAICKKCHKPKRNKMESEIDSFINSYGILTIRNTFDIVRSANGNKAELDILVPDHGFAIEFNGLKFHSFGSDKYSKFNNAMFESNHKNNHLNKTLQCEEQGIRLFHIFENEWLHKQDIWKSMILSQIQKTQKIYARNTVLKEITSKESEEFLNLNHIQGNINASVKLGLFYGDELVAVMTFGKPRFNKKYEWELLRFASKLNTTIVGGASKLLKYFERQYRPNSLISYANRRWSVGNLYLKLEFQFVEDTKPNYFYFHPDSPVLGSRNRYQKHMLKHLDSYTADKTETQIMYDAGYRKIYDCGNKVFVKLYSY